MKSKSYHNLMMMTALALSSLGEPAKSTRHHSKKKPELRFKFNFTIPKGARLYLFEANGNFESFTEFASRNEMPSYCGYHTVAISDKSAIKKFNKFVNNTNKNEKS